MPANARLTAWRRRILAALLVSAIGGLLYLAFRPQPLLVDAAQVTRGYLAVTVESEGRTRVRDRYVVSAPIAAQARRLTLDVGDEVRVGDVLVILDPVTAPALDPRSRAEAVARVAAAEAALAASHQEIDAAAVTAGQTLTELTRIEKLAAQRLVAPDVLDRSRAEAQRADAMLRSARFQAGTARSELDAARAALAYAGTASTGDAALELRAPVDGRVLRRHYESSQVVQPGQPLLEIGDPAALEVEVDVLSSDAVLIAPGMRVVLERWGEAEPLEGVVRRVHPTGFTKVSALGVEEQRVWVIVDLVSPHAQWARLGDAYQVNARFVLWEADAVLRVPTSALFRAGEGFALFVVESDRAVRRPVTVGRRGGLVSEVREGLSEGETVVVHPDRDLADGSRVRLRAGATAGGS